MRLCNLGILCKFAFMEIIRIDSLDLAELNVYVHLTEAQLRNRLEPEKGIFIAESLKVVRVALEAGMEPVSFLAEEKYIYEQVLPLIDGLYDVPVYTGSRQTLQALTGYELSRGFLCAMRRPQLPSVHELCESKHRIAVMDGVVNSTNTGAIFRAAAALGIEGILLTPTCCDPLNRRSVRVSMGTVFQLPWTYSPDPVSELSRFGFKTVALALSPDAVDINDISIKNSDKVAIVLGTEGDGLSQKTLSRCSHIAQIPMHRGVDSLNVAAAAAIAFWVFQFKNTEKTL